MNESNGDVSTFSVEEDKLLNYIRGSKGISRLEIESLMQIGKTKSTNLLNGLIDKKAVVKVGVGKSTVYKSR